MTEHPQTRIMKLEHELTKVRQQRDDLLAACEGMIAEYRRDMFVNLDDIREALFACSAAIAKAKEGGMT